MKYVRKLIFCEGSNWALAVALL